MDIQYSEVSARCLKRKGGKCTIHFSAESPNAEPFIRTIHSANQLSIDGAVASWCEELAQLIPGQTHVFRENTVAKANDQLSQQLEPQEVDFPGTDTEIMIKQRETACVFILKMLKNCRTRSNSGKLVHLRD